VIHKRGAAYAAPRLMRRLLTAILLGAAALLSGCGGSAGAAARTRSATLVLDFTPNAVHVGIYTALARHYDLDAGVRLHVVVPSASTDAIGLLEARRVDFAILDIHDLAIARERGEDIVGILPIVERPLAAVIAAPRYASPRDLDGQTVGVTGDPSDTAVLRSVVAGSGGDPARVKTITIGYDAVSDLLAGRVAAATAFWNDEGVELARQRPGFHIFRVDDYGAPSYPELVVCATGALLRADPGLARAVVDTLARGYDAALADPAAGKRDLLALVPGLDAQLVSADLAALAPAFRGPGGRFGVLDQTRLHAWARWEARFGIVSRPPDVATMFDLRFAPRG
jgi:ABC-type nitrate/sulfonate/bicarbonate transport system substrate-binding protein